MKILYSNLLSKYKNISHGITTREGGVSTAKFNSLNLATHVGDTLEDVVENRTVLANHLNISLQQLKFSEQTHSANICTASFLDNNFLDTDALITNECGVCINTLTADCVPIIVFDPIQKCIGVVHAGWKGTVQLILEKTISKMVKEFNSKPEDILVVLGPAISEVNFEVGDEVAAKFDSVFGEGFSVLNKKTSKYHIDLHKVNKYQAIRVGVLEKNVESIKICTFEQNQQFYSARKDGFSTGRFASFIMLKE